MKREILFRGKRLGDGEWVKGGFCNVPPPPQCVGKLPPPTAMIVCEDPRTCTDWGMPRQMCMIDVDPATVGQYTGLKDKNGKRIFEGDVLKSKFGGIYVVDYYDPWCSFRLCLRYELDEDGKMVPISGSRTFVGEDRRRLEVIGNIHDNRERIGEEAQP